MNPAQDPLITFYRVLPGLAPRRGTPCAIGTLPTRAFQYCEAARQGSALGYYVFLPKTFQLEWDGGTGGLWSFDDGAIWHPLTTAAFPDSMATFDAVAPEWCKGFCPPFITFTEFSGAVQIWTGWFARTAPGYSLLVKGRTNIGQPRAYEVLEGVVDTDEWFGPLFAIVRLITPGVPIVFDAITPFLQVLPLHRASYANDVQNRFLVQDADAISPELWRAYERSLIVPAMRNPERGHYAKGARRRRVAETQSPKLNDQGQQGT